MFAAKRLGLLALLLSGAAALPVQVQAQAPADNAQVARRLEELRAMREEMQRQLGALQRQMGDFDAQIDALQSDVQASPPALPQPPATSLQSAIASTPPAAPPAVIAVNLPADQSQSSPQETSDVEGWGAYQPGKGYVFVRSDNGELSLSLISYVRYLNQLGLDPTYTDSFERTKTLDLRQDLMLNKVNLTFKGWIFDPDFSFRAWIWTQNPAMGLGAQVVVGGQLGYRFADYLNVYSGVGPVPSNRTLNWTYPNWLKMDNRTVADEFFRASYSFGIWADGRIADGVYYRVMIANNLSTLGVDAAQMDANFETLSGTVWWMPTTGEYGPGEGFGDYEDHKKVATRFGVHYTRSREDAQSQPGEDDFENSQIRLSDGTRIFEPGAFATDGRINAATYQMFAANGGFKYRGFALEGEYYARWVDEFDTVGFIPVTDLFDQGYQVEGSIMVVPQRFQLYAAGSQVLGQYGDPWDLTLGLNWFPFARKEMRLNLQGIYMRNSPVGGTSYPYLVGANGWLFNTDVIVHF